MAVSRQPIERHPSLVLTATEERTVGTINDVASSDYALCPALANGRSLVELQAMAEFETTLTFGVHGDLRLNCRSRR